MASQKEKAQDLVTVAFAVSGVGFLERIADCPEVAKRLAHLFFGAVITLDAQRARMHPDVGKGSVVGALALRNLVFVVREDQIRTTTVDVESLAQIVAAHGRAFDVPTRATLTPLRVPGRFARFCGFPKHEVQRIALGLRHFDAGTCAHFIGLTPGELAIACKFAHGIVNVAVFCGIG